jgi:hypothetical protein
MKSSSIGAMTMRPILPRRLSFRVALLTEATYQEAIANLEVIIQEWIETARDLGRTIPEPKGRLVFA